MGFLQGNSAGFGDGFGKGEKSGYNLGFLNGSLSGFQAGYVNGSKAGFEEGVNAVIAYVEQAANLTVKCEDFLNGTYKFTLMNSEDLVTSYRFELHLLARHCRDGVLISETFHPMTLTNNGTHWLAEKLAHSGGTNTTKWATYIGCSASTATVSAGWGALPSEISSNGLSRANGTWAHTTTGYGTWNVTKTFTATGTQSCQMYGYYYSSTGDTAIAVEQQGSGAVKNLILNDTLQITIQPAVS